MLITSYYQNYLMNTSVNLQFFCTCRCWACISVVGSWLAGSGWKDAVAQAGITTSGRAESLVTSAHTTRTRYAHQVTASSLYTLQHRAYKKYSESEKDAPPFPEWCNHQASKFPRFQFWNMTLKFELLIFILVRSFRESDFRLYTAVLKETTPLMFALDRTNYARWLPVHIRDMAENFQTNNRTSTTSSRVVVNSQYRRRLTPFHLYH